MLLCCEKKTRVLYQKIRRLRGLTRRTPIGADNSRARSSASRSRKHVARKPLAEPLIAAANACGLGIPNDIAIISVGDETSLCERLSPSLTAFKPEYGILAERAMAMLEGEQTAAEHDGFTFTLVRRQSTRRFKRRDADVENAVERIRKEACSGLKPRDILSGFSCSCRMAEIRFKAVTRSTIERAILDARLERCRELLSDGKTPIGNIADSCGFPSPLVMRRQFRARMKMTPREWRQTNSEQSPKPPEAT